MGEELLFNKQDIFSVVQGQTAAVKKGVQAIPANTLLNASEHDLTQALVAELRLDVPRINDEVIHIASTGETQNIEPQLRDVPRINDEGIHIASTGETQVD